MTQNCSIDAAGSGNLYILSPVDSSGEMQAAWGEHDRHRLSLKSWLFWIVFRMHRGENSNQQLAHLLVWCLSSLNPRYPCVASWNPTWWRAFAFLVAATVADQKGSILSQKYGFTQVGQAWAGKHTRQIKRFESLKGGRLCLRSSFPPAHSYLFQLGYDWTAWDYPTTRSTNRWIRAQCRQPALSRHTPLRLYDTFRNRYDPRILKD